MLLGLIHYVIPLLALIAFAVIMKVHQKVTHVWAVGKMIPDKIVIITEGNAGIGYETAKGLSKRGGRVILACKDINKAEKVASEITSCSGFVVYVKYLDLASFKSILAFAHDIIQTIGRVDILINNAVTGVLDNSLTEDNLPIEAQINHFGPFFLTMLLLPVMKNLEKPARIINLSSFMHVFGTVDNLDKQAKNFIERRRIFSNTKLANLLFTLKLAEIVADYNIIVNCLNPDTVTTDVIRDQNIIIRLLLEYIFLTPEEGAQTSIHLAVVEPLPGQRHVTGKYFSNCKEIAPSKLAQNQQVAGKLWILSIKICLNKKRE